MKCGEGTNCPDEATIHLCEECFHGMMDAAAALGLSEAIFKSVKLFVSSYQRKKKERMRPPSKDNAEDWER